jgi:ribosomal protein S18 acetylase RimI-like enzyme
MICQEWRDAGDTEVAALFEAERRRWLDVLRWDTLDSWAVVETGRLAGHVAGWIARDGDGRPQGWTFYLLQDGALQIGGLTARRASVARLLLDAILSSPEADLARTLSCFLFPAGTGTLSAFERQRFAMGETLYLERRLGTAGGPAGLDPRVRPWKDSDLAAAVRLFAAAYRGVPGAASFAPEGRLDQWARYTGRLIGTPACGHFDPALTFAIESTSPADMLGAVLVSRISPDTAHLMQIAVSPDSRRQGIGDALLRSAMEAAAAAGCTAMTLMVDAGNAVARQLYAAHGFTETGRFLHGARPARTRVVAA